jgi:hypothetical protein
VENTVVARNGHHPAAQSSAGSPSRRVTRREPGKSDLP